MRIYQKNSGKKYEEEDEDCEQYMEILFNLLIPK